MARRTTLILILAVVAAACTVPPVEEAPGATTTTPTEETTTVALPEIDLPGRLVILDRGRNIAVVDPDGSDMIQLTSDAGTGAAYTQPLWSPDASLIAWGQVTDDGPATAYQRVTAPSPTVVPMSSPPFYMFWSPDAATIGVLHNSADQVIDFEMVDVAQGSATVVDGGAPYYFSWSPDGTQVIAHVGEAGFAIIDLAGTKSELGITAAGYLAPHWTPRGIFHVVDGVLVVEEEGERRMLADLPGPVTFVANSQGTLVAVQSARQAAGTPAAYRPQAQQAAPIPVNAVVVVDVETSEVEIAVEQAAVGFFWSPDGRRLLILRLSPSGAVLDVLVWEVGGGLTAYPSFAPHGTFVRDVLPFFPQYAQSLSLWAPDSSAFAYAGELGGERGIWVQVLEEPQPRLVAEGSWVSWSGR
ncbi:MAG TPA: hypothetical protein EYP73_00270 [Acidimicrobiia bacterium]|nr:hypothetical protein [Acidimicrobiia bacterium]